MPELSLVNQAFLLLRGQERWTQELEDEIKALQRQDTAENRESFGWGAVYEVLIHRKLREDDGENEMLGE